MHWASLITFGMILARAVPADLVQTVRISGELQEGPGQHGSTGLMPRQQDGLDLKAELLLHRGSHALPSLLHA